MKKKHWTERKMRAFPSPYRNSLGSPGKRSEEIEKLYADLDLASSRGNTAWVKVITNQLQALGEGDYVPGLDDGCTPTQEGGL